MKKEWVWVSIAWAGIIAVVIAGLFFFTDIFQKNPIPKNIREQVDFATYYSNELPKDYFIDPNSYEVSGGVLLYAIHIPNEKQITVSQQKPPESFDFNDFHTKQLRNSRSSKIDDGETLYLGTLENNNVASIRTAQTWILLSTDK